MLARLFLAQLLLAGLGANAAPWRRSVDGAQSVLSQQWRNSERIVKSLKGAEVIPDVLPSSFSPEVAIDLLYLPGSIGVNLGNTIPVSETANPPLLAITPIDDHGAALLPSPTRPSSKTLTVVLTDPDATSHADPVKGQMCHWISAPIEFKVLNETEMLQLNNPTAYSFDRPSHYCRGAKCEDGPGILSDLIEYMQPAPPPKTGRHRYIFVLLESKSDLERKPPEKPSDRPHWGYKHIGQGVMEWANDNDLVPIGANFFYAQNKEQ